MKKFQSRAIRFETENALAELELFAANVAAEIRVTHRAVEPVIKAATEIALHRVRVACAPARKNGLPHIGLVVAVSVLEEKHVARFRDDDAAVHEHE